MSNPKETLSALEIALSESPRLKRMFDAKFVGEMPVRRANYFYRVWRIQKEAMEELIQCAPGHWFSMSSMYRDLQSIPIPVIVLMNNGARVEDPLAPLLLQLAFNPSVQVFTDSPECTHALVMFGAKSPILQR